MHPLILLALVSFFLLTAVLGTLAHLAAEERRVIALREQAMALRASYARRLATLRGQKILEVEPIDEKNRPQAKAA
ncbi:MAG: hypothetical protein ACK4WH_09870 [Phycisphaerales bacterium]